MPSNLTLGARLDAATDARREQARPSMATLDKIADRLITGGYTAANRLCPKCRVKMPLSGQCDSC